MQNQVADFINTARQNGCSDFCVADYATAKALRATHLRAGKIAKGAPGAGEKVLAYGFDELGNTVALCRDGATRQFI